MDPMTARKFLCRAAPLWAMLVLAGCGGTGGVASSDTTPTGGENLPSSSDDAAPVPAVDGPVVTRFEVVDDGAGGARPAAFGLPLPEGAVAPGEALVVTDAQGNPVPSQWSELATWRTDRSVLHGVMSFRAPGAGMFEVRRAEGGAANAAAPLTRADLTAAGFDARIQVTAGDGTYSLSAAELLDGDLPARQDHTHFAGPLAAEFALGGPLLLNGNGPEHHTLQGYFHLRAFAEPAGGSVERIYATLVLENTGAFRTLEDVTGDVSLSVGGQVVYTNNGFTVGADRRYPKRFWWGGDPDLWVRHDTEFVEDTALVPEYREFGLAEELLNGFPRSVDWHGQGQLSSALDSGGAAAHLAPLDRWAAAYLVSADRRAYDAMRAHADAYHWVVSHHRYAMNPRDEDTGHALDLAQHRQAIGSSWSGSNALAAARETRLPMKTDMAHQPNCAYLPYLLTGEYDYLEHCQLWGVANWVMERPGSGEGWPRPFFWGQTRAVAWGFRNIANAAVITPDGHPLKPTLDQAVGYAIDSFRGHAMPLSPLGIWATGPGVGTAINMAANNTPDPDDSGRTGFTPWEDDYLTWALGSAVERGYAADTVWPWKAQAVVERLGDGTRFCWANATMYSLGIRQTEDGPNYTNWRAVQDANFPGATCPAAGTTGVGSDRTATDYGAQMAGAVSVAVDTGIAGARAAWDRYKLRENAPDFDWWSGGFEKFPEWAIKPRDGLGGSDELSSGGD